MDVATQLDQMPVPRPPDGSVQSFMARFSEGATHTRRRAIAEDRLAAMRPDELRSKARERTAAILEGRDRIEVMSELARRVPVAVLALALGASEADLDVAVSTTQKLSTALAPPEGVQPRDPWDEVELLTQLLGIKAEARSEEAVNVVSLLFQATDATAGFIGNALLAPSGVAQQTVIRTYRTDADGFRREIPLDDPASVLPFGAGHHRCPGETHARAIAAGVLEGLNEAGAQTANNDHLEYEPRMNSRIPVRIVMSL